EQPGSAGRGEVGGDDVVLHRDRTPARRPAGASLLWAEAAVASKARKAWMGSSPPSAARCALSTSALIASGSSVPALTAAAISRTLRDDWLELTTGVPPPR